MSTVLVHLDEGLFRVEAQWDLRANRPAVEVHVDDERCVVELMREQELVAVPEPDDLVVPDDDTDDSQSAEPEVAVQPREVAPRKRRARRRAPVDELLRLARRGTEWMSTKELVKALVDEGWDAPGAMSTSRQYISDAIAELPDEAEVEVRGKTAHLRRRFSVRNATLVRAREYLSKRDGQWVRMWDLAKGIRADRQEAFEAVQNVMPKDSMWRMLDRQGVPRAMPEHYSSRAEPLPELDAFEVFVEGAV